MIVEVLNQGRVLLFLTPFCIYLCSDKFSLTKHVFVAPFNFPVCLLIGFSNWPLGSQSNLVGKHQTGFEL